MSQLAPSAAELAEAGAHSAALDSAPAPYQRLTQRFARLARLNECREILGWDSAVNLPAGSTEGRGAQLAELAGLAREQLADPAVADWLGEAAQQAERLHPWQRANLREMQRQYRQATALPAELMQRLVRAATRTERRWRSAKAENDFAGLLPDWQELLGLQQEAAQAKAEAAGRSPYDALLDEFEPDLTESRVKPVFDRLAEVLPPLVAEIRERQAAAGEPPVPEGPFAETTQRELGERLMGQLGFDFERGRLDTSTHPFCGGTADDIRLTTRFRSDDFFESLMGVLHETGHALYELGRPPAWRDQPVGESRGMLVHESQSTAIEMQACRSRAFLSYLAPLARDAFGGVGPAWSAESFAARAQRVRPGFIRVEADEATYSLHIILRYRLEKALLSGDLPLADLPGAWREQMEALLGLTPPDDRHGCLQDIHWPAGAIGYFPTYALGQLMAAQLVEAAQAQGVAVADGLAEGDFAPLVGWLRRHVHGWGKALSFDGLLEAATGAPLDSEAFERHLRSRYLGG